MINEVKKLLLETNDDIFTIVEKVTGKPRSDKIKMILRDGSSVDVSKMDNVSIVKLIVDNKEEV